MYVQGINNPYRVGGELHTPLAPLSTLVTKLNVLLASLELFELVLGSALGLLGPGTASRFEGLVTHGPVVHALPLLLFDFGGHLSSFLRDA